MLASPNPIFFLSFDMDEMQTSPQAQKEHIAPTATTRKRKLDSDNNAEPRTKRAWTTQPTSEPARLTRKNLALFDKMGNTKGSKKTSTHRNSTDGSSTTKTLSTTASGFAIKARENGILDPLDSKPPKNLEDIRKRLAESRATASPTESVYGDYVHTVGEAPNEATMVGEMLPLLKKYPRGYKRRSTRHSQPSRGTLASTTVYRLRNPTMLKGSGWKNTARSRSTSISTELFSTRITPVP